MPEAGTFRSNKRGREIDKYGDHGHTVTAAGSLEGRAHVILVTGELRQ